MIKSVTVTNYLGDSIKLELARPELSGFVIKSITGIGPGEADINTTEISTNDGSVFNSAKKPERDIEINIKYLWKDTIEEARHLSYKYFPLKKKVTLLFETDDRTAEIEGYVKKNEPNIFSKTETTDIIIRCPDPFFYSAEKNTTVFSGIEPMFEFPFSNESLTESLIEISIIRNFTEKTIFYEGDSEIGVTITIHAMGEVSNITIYNTGTREVMRIDTSKIVQLTGSGIVAGDDIVISTVENHKFVHLIRGGITTNILNSLDRSSDWFQLTKGENVFAYVAEEGGTNLTFTIENRIVFEGV